MIRVIKWMPVRMVPFQMCSRVRYNRFRQFSAKNGVAETDTLKRMFRSTLTEDLFAASFLSALPLKNMQTILSSIAQQVGSLSEIKHLPSGEFELLMSKGKLRVTCHLDADKKIIGFRIVEINANKQPLDQLVRQFSSLSGDVSLLVSEREHDKAAWKNLVALNEHKALGVGSAFKMVVLRALKAEIEGGARRWSDVVELHEQDRSLSSMALNDWPSGSPLTLFSLAADMISKSDNTATDALMRIVGREKIERFLPATSVSRNTPFLCTRDLFVLKSKGNEELLHSYRNSASVADRRSILLKAASRPLPVATDFPLKPTAHDVEWLFNPFELREIIDAVSSLQAMQINPGVAKREAWTSIAFKGGSEPGVINLTHHLRKGQRQFACVATWNTLSEEQDTTAFSLQVQSLIAQLEQ